MKILGKNVYIGKKCICTEFTREVDDLETLHTHEKSHNGIIIEENVLFIEDKHGLFVDINDISSLGGFALKVYGAAPRWPKNPTKAGSKYIDIKPYFSENNKEQQFDLKYLISLSQSLKIEDSSNLSL